MANESVTPNHKEPLPRENTRENPTDCIITVESKYSESSTLLSDDEHYVITLRLNFTPRQKDGKPLCILSEDALVTEIEKLLESLDPSLEFTWKEQLEAEEFDKIHNAFPEGCPKDPTACKTCEIPCPIVHKWEQVVEDRIDLSQGKVVAAISTTPYFAQSIQKLKENGHYRTYGECFLELFRFHIAELAERVPFYPVRVEPKYLPTMHAGAAYHGLPPDKYLTKMVEADLKGLKDELKTVFNLANIPLEDEEAKAE